MASSKFLAACGILGFILLAGCGAVFVNEGSKNASLAHGLANPEKNTIKVNVTKDASVISNFDDGSNNGNPKLFGDGSGTWATMTWAGNAVNSNFVVKGGANGTKMAAHVFGSLTDKGDASYPEFDLQFNFKGKDLYDASNFAGIKFYYKCPAADQALKRRFNIATAPTLPMSDGGTCESACYNHYGANLKPISDWTALSYNFSDLTRLPGWGSPVAPPELTEHLKEFIYIKWGHSADNAAGTYTIDYWVDEVEFF